MGIFKAYDIRGVVPDELRPQDAYCIARAAGRFLAAKRMAVGADVRRSSPELKAQLIRGLQEEGIDVVDLGAIATPMLYFAVESLGVDGGIMVTASHNPPQYNGFKICRAHAIPVSGASGLQEIEKIASSCAQDPVSPRRGSLQTYDVTDEYAAHILALLPEPPSLRVVIDAGNGMVAAGLRAILARLPLEAELLYFEPDGTFPNHEADPLKLENLQDLIRAVKQTSSHFGVAFDGDADRAAFVDETGNPVSSDLMTAILAKPRLAAFPGGRVLYDLRSSRATPEAIEEWGGVAEMCRVGHSFIKAQMRESGAIFAGELSGHFYFRFSENLIADDGMAAFVSLCAVLAQEQKPLSQLVAPLRRYAASGEINTKVRDIHVVLAGIEAEHRAQAQISHLDGLLVVYPDWWFNLRASNTEPVLRLNLEANTSEAMQAKRDAILTRIHELGGA